MDNILNNQEVKICLQSSLFHRKKMEILEEKRSSFSFSGKDEQSFLEIAQAMQKNERTPYEKQIIFHLLSGMSSIIQVAKEAHDNYIGLLRTICNVIRYEKAETNRIIFKTGQEGVMFYIILKGKAAVILPKVEKIEMSEEEYVLYVAKLRLYEEKELLAQCLAWNAGAYPIPVDDLDNYIKTYSDNFMKVLASKYNLEEMSQNENFNGTNKETSGSPDSFYFHMNKVLSNTLKDKICRKISRTQSLLRLGTYRRCSINLNEKVENVNQYIERCSPVFLPNSVKKEKKKVKIYKYFLVRFLGTGEIFGDLALNQVGKKRTATIIPIEETHLGTLDQNSYKHCLQDYIERIRKGNINFLSAHHLFESYNRVLFEKNIYMYFSYEKASSNQLLIQEGEEATTVYFLREGEFEIFSNKSIKEIRLIIESLGGEPVEAKETESTTGDKVINIHQKRYVRIAIINNSDILGLSDLMYGDKFAFSVKCLSSTCEFFKIDIDGFKKYCLTDKRIKEKVIEYIRVKKQILLNRLTEVKNMRLKCQNLFNSAKVNEIHHTKSMDYYSSQFISDHVRNVNVNESSDNRSSFKDSCSQTTSNNFFPAGYKPNNNRKVFKVTVINHLQKKRMNHLNLSKDNPNKSCSSARYNGEYYTKYISQHLLEDKWMSTKSNIQYQKKSNSSVSFPSNSSKVHPKLSIKLSSHEDLISFSQLSTVSELRKKLQTTSHVNARKIAYNSDFSNEYIPSSILSKLQEKEEVQSTRECEMTSNFHLFRGAPLVKRLTKNQKSCDENYKNNLSSFDNTRQSQVMDKNKSESNAVLDLLAMDNFNRVYNTEDYYSVFRTRMQEVKRNPSCNFIISNTSHQQIKLKHSLTARTCDKPGKPPHSAKIFRKYDIMVTGNKIIKLDNPNESKTSGFSIKYGMPKSFTIGRKQKVSRRIREIYSNVMRRVKQAIYKKE